jgi:hypothetical protein
MNEEQIEFELMKLKSERVILVAPFYGSISHSYVGHLNTTAEGHPILFHFQGEGIATIFHASDVKSVKELNEMTKAVIRLKGPSDFNMIAQTIS